jgi:7-cyano-7-deazaguanine reductase
MNKPEQSELGQKSEYITKYSPDLLFPIPRKIKRDEINCPTPLPFVGHDVWQAYELSWLGTKGKPEVAIARFEFSADSDCIIESKSFKLYLNSFNNSTFESPDHVLALLEKDLSKAACTRVRVKLYHLHDMQPHVLSHFPGISLDAQDITCTEYTPNPALLYCDGDDIIEESLFSDLLKSNCLVTEQPDWGSVRIRYRGRHISHPGLLRYIVSFRNHNEFHEQCVERIFMDITSQCQPEQLSVEARYTRRGGLDINPIRTSEPGILTPYQRLVRQ